MIITLLSSASSAIAQNADIERFQRQLEQVRRDTRLRIDPEAPVGQRTLVSYGAYLSANYLSLDDTNDNNHTLWQPELVLYGRFNLDGVHDFFIRGRTGYEDFSPGDSFTGDPDNFFGPKLERAVYRFDLQRARTFAGKPPGDSNFVFTGGRDLIYWANGLVLSQVIDGATIDLSSGPVGLTLMAGMTDRDTVDFDSSRPEFDDNTQRFYYGLMLSKQVGRHRPFAYVLAQRDMNEQTSSFSVSSPFATATSTVRFDYNSYYAGVGANGAIRDNIVYGLEVAYEGGSGLSNGPRFDFGPDGSTPIGIPQTREEIQAMAADARLDYLFADQRQTRASVEVILATGDTDRTSTSNTFAGNAPGTKDHAFNALGLLYTGNSFNPQVSNIIIARAGISMFPAPQISALRRLQIGADVFLYNKFRENGPIDEPTSDGDRYLGWEPDIFLNWRITSDVTLALRYGIFFPGDAILSGDDPRQFFFAGLTFAL